MPYGVHIALPSYLFVDRCSGLLKVSWYVRQNKIMEAVLWSETASKHGLFVVQ